MRLLFAIRSIRINSRLSNLYKFANVILYYYYYYYPFGLFFFIDDQSYFPLRIYEIG